MNRREFISSLAIAGATIPLLSRGANTTTGTFQFNCFTKHLQWLDYKETAEVLKAAGYDGAYLTVRPDGHVLPERVEEDLPRAVEAFKAVGLKVPMIVSAQSALQRPCDPGRRCLARENLASGEETRR